MRSLVEKCCSARFWIHVDLGPEGRWVVPHSLTAPVEQEIPMADQPSLNPTFLIPEVDHLLVQDQHGQISSQTLNHSLY